MRNNQTWELLECGLILSLMIFVYCGDLAPVTFHPDESQWIANSSIFEAFVHGNNKSPGWKESYWALINPPLPPYIIGLGRIIGGLGISDLNDPWDFGKDYKTNIEQGRMPSDELLWWSRLPMGILAVTSIFAGFILLKILAGRIPAYIWIGLCTYSSYFQLMLKRAMSESPLLASIMLILLITYKLLLDSDNKEIRNPGILYIYSIILGVGSGLAGSSKLNGLSTLACGITIAIIVAFRKIQTTTLKIRFCMLAILIVILSSQFTFIFLNQYLWPDPLVRFGTLINQRAAIMRAQQADYPNSRIEGFNQRLQVVPVRVFQSYAAIRFDGSQYFNFIFFLIGISYILIRSLQYIKRLNNNPASMAILIVSAFSSLPPIFTPLDWDRYYLLPVTFSTIFIAVGIWWTLSFGYGLIFNKQIPPCQH